MKHSISAIIGRILLGIGIGYVLYALGHPEGFLPFSHGLTTTIYGVYVALTLLAFLVSGIRTFDGKCMVRLGFLFGGIVLLVKGVLRAPGESGSMLTLGLLWIAIANVLYARDAY